MNNYFCGTSPYKPITGDEILSELAESRAGYVQGEGEDFDRAIDEIDAKYSL